jgi:hypothetical protein
MRKLTLKFKSIGTKIQENESKEEIPKTFKKEAGVVGDQLKERRPVRLYLTSLHSSMTLLVAT